MPGMTGVVYPLPWKVKIFVLTKQQLFSLKRGLGGSIRNKWCIINVKNIKLRQMHMRSLTNVSKVMNAFLMPISTVCVCVCVCYSLSRVWLFVTPRTCQAPLSILKARILEKVAIPFPRGSSQPRDQTWVACIAGRFFAILNTREAPTIYKII